MAEDALITRDVIVDLKSVRLDGFYAIPADLQAIVVFAHGSGSSRFSTRNHFVASVLHDAGIGTLLVDLLTPQEARLDEYTRHLRFDIPLLAQRLGAAVKWVRETPEGHAVPLGVFGASTGAAAALMAAARMPAEIGAIVSRGGRPDLAGDTLPLVKAPTLLIVGSKDVEVLALNRLARDRMTCPCDLAVVSGASHLFEEPGTLEEAAGLAVNFFQTCLIAG